MKFKVGQTVYSFNDNEIGEEGFEAEILAVEERHGLIVLTVKVIEDE